MNWIAGVLNLVVRLLVVAVGYDRFSRLPSAAVVVMIAAWLLANPPKSAALDEATRRPLVLVHYMPWFAAKPANPIWGWHWSMNAFDPEQRDGRKRRIASHYYPLIGPYDSGDSDVIEYHLLLMKLAGIDGMIVDWYGLSDQFDYPTLHRNTAALFPRARELDLKIGICFEDQTISKLVEAKVIPARDRVKYARDNLRWLRDHWFADPAYLRLDGRPLLLSFGVDGLTDVEWEQALPAGPDAPLYFSEHRRRGVATGAFDWPVPNASVASLDRFYESAKGWPLAIPAVFPRFHDIYGEAKVHETYGRIADDEGRTFVGTFQRAVGSGARLIQVVTWNDWGEGQLAIEPSLEFGYRDLEVIQQFRRKPVNAKFAYQADDLRLVHRLYSMRRRESMTPNLRGKLDEIGRLLAIGRPSDARAILDRIEPGSR